MLAQSNVKGMSMQPPKNQQASPVFTKLVNPLVAPGIPKVNIESNLNPNLTFDNYIEGESNNLPLLWGEVLRNDQELRHLTHYSFMEV